MTFPCSQCGGKVRPSPGRRRMLGRLLVPDLLGVPTCSKCGERFWNEELIEHVERANKPSPWCITAGEKLIEAAERRCPEVLQQLRAELGIEANMVPSDAEVVKWLDARCEHGWECHRARGTWRGGTLVGSMLTMGAICDSPEAARLSLAKDLGFGKVAECPLPEDWREWKCQDTTDVESAPMLRCTYSDWSFVVAREFVFGNDKNWTIRVHYQGYLVYFAPCKSVEGGRRAAVKAARRAWKVLNG